MHSRKSRSGMVFMLAVCLGMIFAGAGARPAYAQASFNWCNSSIEFGVWSACGCSVYSAQNLGTVTIPKGIICFEIHTFGSGVHIQNMVAGWNAVSLCNWRIDWAIYQNGKTWWRDKGPAHGCSYAAGSRMRGEGWAPDGSTICAELYENALGIKIDAACEAIERESCNPSLQKC